MGIIKRIAKISQAEASAFLHKHEKYSKFENPDISNIKKNLRESSLTVAEVKNLANKFRQEIEYYLQKSNEYEKKAMLLLQRAKEQIIPQEKADKLAIQALLKKEEYDQQYKESQQNIQKLNEKIIQLEERVRQLQHKTSDWLNETTEQEVYQTDTQTHSFSSIPDASQTLDMIERMIRKIESDEILAQSYEYTSYKEQILNEEIDKALNQSRKQELLKKLEELKSRL